MKKVISVLLCVILLGIPVHAEENEKLVALTFDDGPSGRFTRKLLDGLAERGVHATFLLCGYRMEQYPQLTDRIFHEVHEIGLHGYCHKPMQDMCYCEIIQEISKSRALLPDGCNPTFLRSPGGLYGLCAIAAAADQGLSILHWSVDPHDWSTHDAVLIEEEVIRNVRDGDVILLHDMSDSSVEASLVIIDQLQAQGYRFITASELANARDVLLSPGIKYSCFAP